MCSNWYEMFMKSFLRFTRDKKLASQSLCNFSCPAGARNFKIGFSKPIFVPLVNLRKFSTHSSYQFSHSLKIKYYEQSSISKHIWNTTLRLERNGCGTILGPEESILGLEDFIFEMEESFFETEESIFGLEVSISGLEESILGPFRDQKSPFWE